MNNKTQFNKSMKDGMKSGDKVRKRTLRWPWSNSKDKDSPTRSGYAGLMYISLGNPIALKGMVEDRLFGRDAIINSGRN